MSAKDAIVVAVEAVEKTGVGEAVGAAVKALAEVHLGPGAGRVLESIGAKMPGAVDAAHGTGLSGTSAAEISPLLRSLTGGAPPRLDELRPGSIQALAPHGSIDRPALVESPSGKAAHAVEPSQLLRQIGAISDADILVAYNRARSAGESVVAINGVELKVLPKLPDANVATMYRAAAKRAETGELPKDPAQQTKKIREAGGFHAYDIKETENLSRLLGELPARRIAKDGTVLDENAVIPAVNFKESKPGAMEHITLSFGTESGLTALQTAQRPSAQVVAYVGSAERDLQAFVVKIGDTIDLPDGRISHITRWLKGDRTPFQSNALIKDTPRESWLWLKDPIELDTKPIFIPSPQTPKSGK